MSVDVLVSAPLQRRFRQPDGSFRMRDAWDDFVDTIPRGKFLRACERGPINLPPEKQLYSKEEILRMSFSRWRAA